MISRAVFSFVLGEDSDLIRIPYRANGKARQELVTFCLRQVFRDCYERIFTLQLMLFRGSANVFLTAKDKEIQANINDLRSTVKNLIDERYNDKSYFHRQDLISLLL